MSDEITPLEAGQPAPDFSLRNILSGQTIALSDWRGEIVVLNFWSYECAWSRHYDEYFEQRAGEWASAGVHFMHINSNGNETDAETRQQAAVFGVESPILRDVDAQVANAYGALTTPHLFVIDREGVIVYQGAVDDRNFRQREATVNYLDAAVEAALAGRSPQVTGTPAYGCAIVREM